MIKTHENIEKKSKKGFKTKIDILNLFCWKNWYIYIIGNIGGIKIDKKKTYGNTGKKLKKW